MTAIYSQDCSCDSAPEIGFQGIAVQKFSNEPAACIAWLEMTKRCVETWKQEKPAKDRYFLVHGPGGHVIGVKF